MAKTRYVVVMSFSDSYGALNIKYHPDYIFTPRELYWNTGNGYRTDYALNARGNSSFYNHKETTTLWEYRDFYIGNGLPSETGLVGNLHASDIVGMHMGCVDPNRNRTTVSNIAQFTQGVAFTDYERNATSNNPLFGTVGHDKKEFSSGELSWVYSKFVKSRLEVSTSFFGCVV